MTPGTVINIPANVKHWHGAAEDSWFSHLAIEVPGEETSTKWLEDIGVILRELASHFFRVPKERAAISAGGVQGDWGASPTSENWLCITKTLLAQFIRNS